MEEVALNPYAVLGLDASCTLDDAELAYHTLLRRHHPDLHQSGTASEREEAEIRTRELNDAIGLFRAGEARAYDDAYATEGTRHTTFAGQGPTAGDGSGPTAPPGPGPAWGDHARDDPRTGDAEGSYWSYEPPSDAVACPLCGLGFAHASEMKAHASHVHHVRIDPRPARSPRTPFGRWLHMLPQLPLWGLVPLNLVFALVVGAIALQIDQLLAYWAFAVTLAPTAIVLFGKDDNDD